MLLPPSSALATAMIAVIVATAAVIDVRTRRVPNALTGSAALLGVALAAAGLGRVALVSSIAGCGIGLALMLPGYLLGGTGGGDVKLLAAVGTLLGPGGTLRAFVATAIAGGVLALVVSIQRRRVRATLAGTARLVESAGANRAEIEDLRAGNRFAYAPAIAIGAIVAALTS